MKSYEYVSYVATSGFVPVAGTVNNTADGGVSEVAVCGRDVAGPEDARVRFKVAKVEMTRRLTRGRWSRLDYKEVNEKEEIVNTMEPLTQSCLTSFAFQDNLAVKERGRKAGGKVKENTLSISISKTISTSSNTSTISSKTPTAFKLVKLDTMERDSWTQLSGERYPI